MAKTEPKYAVIEVRLPAKLGEVRDLPIEVTTHVGGEVRKHSDELTMCDGLDTDMFSLSPLKPFAKKVPGMKWRDEENFSHFAPSRQAARYRADCSITAATSGSRTITTAPSSALCLDTRKPEATRGAPRPGNTYRVRTVRTAYSSTPTTETTKTRNPNA